MNHVSYAHHLHHTKIHGSRPELHRQDARLELQKKAARLTSSDSPVMTRAASPFRRKEFSSRCASARSETCLKVWIVCVRETRRELLAIHVAVSSLSPVNIQTWTFGKQQIIFNISYNVRDHEQLWSAMNPAAKNADIKHLGFYRLTVWNSLPCDLHDNSLLLNTFKQKLKIISSQWFFLWF